MRRAAAPVQLTEAEQKVWIRREVLAAVRPARVFDAYAGTGVLWAGAWKHADAYTGCDLQLYLEDERRRFVGDCRRVMRAIDLAPFNLFDFDAPRAPWEALAILAARRRWAPGELGAVVLTDATRAPKPGVPVKLERGVIDIIGPAAAERLERSPADLHAALVRGFAKLAGVQVAKSWRLDSPGARSRIVSALVFRGAPAA